MRYLGNHGYLGGDVSSGALGTTITEIPYVTEIATKTDRPKIDGTAMGDTYEMKSNDFPSFEITVQLYDNSASNALAIVNDGVDRLFVTCEDTTQTTKKGYTGLGQWSYSGTTKIRAHVGGTLTITSSDGNPTPYYASSIPDPT